MILFIIKFTVSLLVIYALYMIFFARENVPVFKRYFLISGIVFSLLVSFLRFDVETASPEVIPVAVSSQIVSIDAVGSEMLLHDSSGWGIKHIVAIFYLSVSLLLLVRYVLNIRCLIMSGRNAIQFNGYNLSVLKGGTGIYSFLNTIYINEKDYNNGDIRKEILIHELTHIKQKHSIDIIFIEFLQVIFWFNPLLILFKKQMRLNHEYLADNGVINSDIDIIDYQNFILHSVFRNNLSYLASSFNYSFTKKRFIMLKKERSIKRMFFKGITVIPVIALLILLTFSPKMMASGMEEWWEPILKKHNLEAKAYNNFERVFIMGDNNSITDNVCTVTNATVIVKGEKDNYMLIEAKGVTYNIETGELIAESAVATDYSNTDSGDSNIIRSYESSRIKTNVITPLIVRADTIRVMKDKRLSSF